MASEFDELIQQLKLVQTAPEPFGKALPAFTGPAPRSFDLKGMGKQLDLMAKSLGIQKAPPMRRRKPSEREVLLKSLVSIREGISKSVAAGSLSHVQRTELEMRLNTQIQNALSHFKTGGQ